jgi:hypothetical protein
MLIMFIDPVVVADIFGNIGIAAWQGLLFCK